MFIIIIPLAFAYFFSVTVGKARKIQIISFMLQKSQIYHFIVHNLQIIVNFTFM